MPNTTETTLTEALKLVKRDADKWGRPDGFIITVETYQAVCAALLHIDTLGAETDPALLDKIRDAARKSE